METAVYVNRIVEISENENLLVASIRIDSLACKIAENLNGIVVVKLEVLQISIDI